MNSALRHFPETTVRIGRSPDIVAGVRRVVTVCTLIEKHARIHARIHIQRRMSCH